MTRAFLLIMLVCSLGGCGDVFLGTGLILKCLPSLIDTDPYRQLCGPKRVKPAAWECGPNRERPGVECVKP